MLTQPLARVLGEVQRQRSVRAKQAEEPHLERADVRPRVENEASGAGANDEIRLLSEAYWLRQPVARACPQRGFDVEQTLEPPQRLVEVVPVRRLRQPRRRGLQCRPRAPLRHPSLDLTPAQRTQDSLGERVDRT